MAQPVSEYQYTYVGAVGSVVLKDIGATLARVIIPGTYVGTVMLYDSATVAGTASTNTLGTFGLPTTNVYKALDFGIRTRYGLTYTATGTPNLLIAWE